MNQKEGSRWELRLGLAQVVILLGLTMGFLTCAFFLGYFSGRQVGQDAALSASLTNTIKLPINDADQEERADEGASQRAASEVYAKLNDNKGDKGAAADGQPAAEMPRLGTINTTADAPVDTAPGEEQGVPENGGAQAAGSQGGAEAHAPEPAATSATRDQLLKQVIELGAAKEGDAAHGQPPAADHEKGAEVAPTLPPVKPAEKATEIPTPKATKATPTPKPTKTPKQAAQGDTLPKGWFAQVAAPKKKEDAAELSRQLRKSGFTVIVEVAQVRGEQYYRILTGPEQSRSQAEKLVEQLSREPYIPTKPFVRQIK